MRYGTMVVGHAVRFPRLAPAPCIPVKFRPASARPPVRYDALAAARVSECLAAIRDIGWPRAWTRRFRRPGA